MSQHSILIITNRVPYPMNDGGNLAVQAMINGYHDAGMQVYLLAMNTSRHKIPTEQLPTLFSHINGFEVADINNDVRNRDVVLNYLFSRKPNHVVRFKNAGFARKLEDVLKKFKPDIVQVESIFLTSYLPVIKKFAPGVATVLRLHNIEYQIWQRFGLETSSPLKRHYLKSLARRLRRYEEQAWASYNLLLPITEVDAALVRGSGINTAMVVAPFGINNADINMTEEQATWSAYHLGAMDWMPNKESLNWFLEEVWPDMRKKLPEFEFYFAGRQMPEIYKKLNLPGAHCMGEVPDAAHFVANKKILIVPLRSGGGIRVKILEAMAMNKVVISTDVGIQGIDAEANRHYLAANTKEEFIKAVQWCLENKVMATRIGEQAAQLVKEKYERRTITKRIITKLDLMLHSKR
jgi:hypothetical protein